MSFDELLVALAAAAADWLPESKPLAKRRQTTMPADRLREDGYSRWMSPSGIGFLRGLDGAQFAVCDC